MTSSIVQYRVGIDVGLYSVGLAAVQVDDNDKPIKLLSCLSQIHDGGIDPDSNKTATTRLAVSGVARRTRRLYQQRRRRLKNLDSFLICNAYPLPDLESFPDPHLPWKVRAELATKKIENEEELRTKLSIALRHIARHRGWRNPYVKAESLLNIEPPSEDFLAFINQLNTDSGYSFSSSDTLPQILTQLDLYDVKLRGEKGILDHRFRQTDFAREILTIASVQDLDEKFVREAILKVFAAKSPKGSAQGRVGKDPLNPSQNRALKASDAFQRYRIATLIANLRIQTGTSKKDEPKKLKKEELRSVYEFLLNYDPKKTPTWSEVADLLGVDLGNLRGRTDTTDDGERSGARPPLHETNRTVLTSKAKSLAKWWAKSNDPEKAAMIDALSNSAEDDFESQAGQVVWDFISSLSPDEAAKLDSIRLPIGRAAYSETTLNKITQRILETGEDLHKARREIFGLPADWAPPAPAINEPVGNPSVDRVLNIVHRWLSAVQREYGLPLSINIEHVREGFKSIKESRKIEREMAKRNKENDNIRDVLRKDQAIEGKVSSAQLRRYLAVERQQGKCLYCGSGISFENCDIDHIVPRAGAGSTNTRDNLVAVCRRCNHAKSNIPFGSWVKTANIPGVSLKEAIQRVRSWTPDPYMDKKQAKQLQDAVIVRLKRTYADEPIDNRSIESVAWMANELRSRIAHWAKSIDTEESISVRVFRGEITATARVASDFNKITMIGSTGKTRLDRRHHAVDAAVISMLSAGPAKILAERKAYFNDECALGENHQRSRNHEGTPEESPKFQDWIKKMERLRSLVQEALDQDEIPVTQNIRLRLGNGVAHEATISPLKKVPLSSAFTVEDIYKASNGALWTALVNLPDYDPKDGLPENPDREINVNGKIFRGNDLITFSPFGTAVMMEVRNGAVKLGTPHHIRIFKINKKGKISYGIVRVYTQDLLPHRHEDLFSVVLPAHSISLRFAHKTVREAIAAGNAEYIGWLVPGDEVKLDADFIERTHPELVELFGPVTRWRFTGAETAADINLKPAQLSREGLPENVPHSVQRIFGKSYKSSAAKILSEAKMVIIRRDALGRIRLESNAHLPITWKV